VTKKAKTIVLLPITTFALAGLLLSCTSVNDLVPRSGEEPGKAKLFQLSGLSINPSEVAARDEVVITAEVTNVSGVDDTYNAELKINNVTEASDKVSVPAGKTQTLTFVLFKDVPGTYKVNLGQLVGKFTVVGPVAAGPGNQASAVPAQTWPNCCGIGSQSSPSLGPNSGGCCGTGIQNNPAQPGRRSGCCGY
jgi:hypothetical protein